MYGLVEVDDGAGSFSCAPLPSLSTLRLQGWSHMAYAQEEGLPLMRTTVTKLHLRMPPDGPLYPVRMVLLQGLLLSTLCLRCLRLHLKHAALPTWPQQPFLLPTAASQLAVYAYCASCLLA
jgi:hypothetical protein